jgi:hypothetical protein
MKSSRFVALALITALVACNPTLPPPPPGWSLELRAGTTNIDRSFFQSTKPDPTRSSVDETRFQQLREAIIKKVPNLNLGSALASGFTLNTKASNTNARETVALALSLFMAVSKDGAAPKSDLSFVYSGPTGAYDKPITYPAGNAWIASPLVIPKGNGQYTFSSTLQDGTLAGNVSVNLEDQTQWLPFAQQVVSSNPFASSMAQYGNVFIANWQPVPGAQSYLGLIFDRTDPQKQKLVGSFLTKGTRIETQDFVSVQDHVYSLDLISTTIDLTKDNAQSYGALPTSMQSSIFSFGLSNYGGAPNMFIEQPRVNVLAKPNQVGEAILKIKNIGTSPLGYTATISGTGLELSTNAKSIVLYEETRELNIKGTCTNADLTGAVTLTTNDLNNKTKVIPVTLECDVPVSATLELSKLSHNSNISLARYSPDGTKLATSDGMDIFIWDAATGNAIRKFTPSNAQSPYGTNVFSFAWHPASKLMVVGGVNTVAVFDTSTGSSLTSASPSGTIQSVDWNPNGSQFVIGLPTAAQIYDGSSSGLIRRIEFPNSANSYYASTVSWSKSSGKLATTLLDRVTVWDTATGTELNHYVGISTSYTGSTAASWNSTGDKLVFRLTDGNIGIWSVANANLERTIAIEPSNLVNGYLMFVSEVKWSPVGSSIAVIVQKSSNDGTSGVYARTWDASNGNFQLEFPIKELITQQTPSIDWTFNGQSLVVPAYHIAVNWNATTGARGTQFGFVQGAVTSVHFNDDGTKLLVGANPGNSTQDSLNLMDVPSGLVTKGIATTQVIKQVDWRKGSDQVLAIFAGGGFVQAYTPSTWGQLNTYEGYAPSVYSPDGTKIAASLNDSRVRILNASTGAVLQTLDTAVTTGCPGCGGSGIQNLVWSPDSSKIALIANTYASKLRLFDVVTAQLLWEKDANNNWYPDYNLLWSPDGKQISFGYQFFDANTGNLIEVFTLNTPGGNPAIIAWSPESRYVITKTGNFIELRNANSGRKILSLFELSGPGIAQLPQKLAIDWNAQSNRIAVTDGNSSVYVYKFSQP